MFNKSEIMKNAHIIHKTTGISLSAAFIKAWALAKIGKIDDQLFMLNMIDFQSAEDKKEINHLYRMRNELNDKIDPPPPKPVYVPLTDAEREQAEAQWDYLMNDCEEIDWNALREIEDLIRLGRRVDSAIAEAC